MHERVPERGLRRGTRLRTLVVALVVLALLGGAGGTWWWLGRDTAANQAAATAQLVAAAPQTVKETVSATGTIQPANEANLVFAHGGKVTTVGVKVGDTVTAGQALATIDPTALQAAVTLAGEQLSAAQAQLSAATAAASSTQIASASAQVTSAQTALTAAQQALGEATLTTPLAGTVAAVNVAVGDTVTGGAGASGSSAGAPAVGSAAGAGASGGGAAAPGAGSAATGASSAASSAASAQIVVIATNAWVVQATVGASDLPKLKNGLQATITPTGATQPIFGTVSTVGVIGTTSGGTSTFPVTISVTGSPAGIYAGTTADVVITVRQVPDVLTVPTAAIHQENGQTVVYQVKGGAQVSTPVTVGTVYGADTQITKGLSPGDEVVVTGRTGRTSSGTATGGPGTVRNGGTGPRTGGFGAGALGAGGLGGG